MKINSIIKRYDLPAVFLKFFILGASSSNKLRLSKHAMWNVPLVKKSDTLLPKKGVKLVKSTSEYNARNNALKAIIKTGAIMAPTLKIPRRPIKLPY